MKDDNAGRRPVEPVLSDYDQNPGRVRLARYLPDGTWVGLDNSQTMLARAVRDYLIGKQVAPDRAQAVAAATEPPLSVTKRGALLFARKSR